MRTVGRLVRSVLAALACALISGCAGYLIRYPMDWAPLISGESDCSSINGLYENNGISVGSKNPVVPDRTTAAAYLDRLLLRGESKELADRVEIAVTDERALVITAVYLKGRAERHQFSLDESEFHCIDGRLYRSGARLVSGTFVAGVLRGSVSVAKAIDGSLVAEKHGVFAGLAMVPTALADRSWARFQAYSSTRRDVITPMRAPENLPSYEGEDLVNCVTDGARRWVYRSQCD